MAERVRLQRERVLTAAVDLADSIGIDAVSMRRLAAELGVVPMALYKHVADKDALVDGMVDVALSELGPLEQVGAWRPTVRRRVLATREVMLRHPWLRRVLETRPTSTLSVLSYTDSLIAVFREAGFSDVLTHHVMHAFGSRMWGFTQELADDGGDPPPPEALAALAQHFPNIAAMAAVAGHDGSSVVAQGCDDQVEFEFALDLLLEGFDRLHQADWRPEPR